MILSVGVTVCVIAAAVIIIIVHRRRTKNDIPVDSSLSLTTVNHSSPSANEDRVRASIYCTIICSYKT
ncbi:hypothetical protein UPYG_G00255370 [Umbra pygmaea]|uniref:Uncharacterized protein n=1 Tax=Umbra pygmaea TaxID=75934 RepID=A0ABD0W974_UMBPY